MAIEPKNPRLTTLRSILLAAEESPGTASALARLVVYGYGKPFGICHADVYRVLRMTVADALDLEMEAV